MISIEKTEQIMKDDVTVGWSISIKSSKEEIDMFHINCLNFNIKSIFMTHGVKHSSLIVIFLQRQELEDFKRLIFDHNIREKNLEEKLEEL